MTVPAALGDTDSFPRDGWMKEKMNQIETGYPQRQGLYDPKNERDACGFGFVVDVKGRASHEIVAQALTVLVNLEHRGAAGAEKNTGDGAGLLLQTPHAFLESEAARRGLKLPRPGHYAAGMVFLPPHEAGQEACVRIFEQVIKDEGQHVIGWREVPTDNASLGPSARASQPVIRQVLVGRGDNCPDPMTFERKLYVIRRLVEKKVSRSAIPGRTHFYVPSLSFKTVVYKGMLNAGQLKDFYLDLSVPELSSAIAMVHSRFSTNTFPSWSRAHPYRYISHNGEINTLRGNINWVHARQSDDSNPVPPQAMTCKKDPPGDLTPMAATPPCSITCLEMLVLERTRASRTPS